MAINQTGIADGVNTKIGFTSEVFDVNNKYDLTNSRWTPAAGVVIVGAGLYFSAGVRNNTFPQAMIFKNGICIGQNGAQSVSNNAYTDVTVVDFANGTDYYECYGVAASSGYVDGVGGELCHDVLWGVVMNEDNVIIVPEEDRVLVVAGEDRTFVVPGEHRIIEVPGHDAG